MKTYQNSISRVMISLGVTALLLGACGARVSSSPELYDEQPARNAFEPGALSESELVSEKSASGYADSTLPEQIDRLIIKNADLSIIVNEPDQSMDRISKLAGEMGGFVVSANLSQSHLASGVQVPRASITIRVPAERLDEALTRIEAESDRLPQNKNISSQDVTNDYTDLQSRLRNLEDAEAQLREIMASASKTEDVLAVYNQLVQVREQIEVIKGQIKYYEQSAALSAISVDLIANEAVQPLTIGQWQPVGVAKDAVQALFNALKFIVTAAIWIAILVLPVLLILYVVIILPLSMLWRIWRRRRNKHKRETHEKPGASPKLPPEPQPPAQ